MKRRDFLKILTLLASSSLLGVSGSKPKEKILVVGAGIVGVTIAYELSRAGVDVHLIDKKYPGSQASGNSFSWINATYPKLPFSYNFLSQMGIEAYKVLSKEVNLKIKWSGSELNMYVDNTLVFRNTNENNTEWYLFGYIFNNESGNIVYISPTFT